MKAPCPDCGRDIGVTRQGRMFAHGGTTGSAYRCPGSGQLPLEPRRLTEVLAAPQATPALGPQVAQEVALGSPPPVREALVAPGAVPVFQLGDRVLRKPDGPYGVVQALSKDGKVFVHWGTTMIRDPKGNQIENRFEDWVFPEELKLSAEPVYFGTEAEHNRVTVWEPPSIKGRS